MGVNHPTSAVAVECGPVILLKQGHSLFLTSLGKLCTRAPSCEGQDEGVCVLCEVPGVVEYAGLMFVVVLQLLCFPSTLCKEARIVGEVGSAGQKTALLEDVDNVAKGACVPTLDVDKPRRCGCGTCCWRWKTAGAL